MVIPCAVKSIDRLRPQDCAVDENEERDCPYSLFKRLLCMLMQSSKIIVCRFGVHLTP
jgi:hypothetical protein